LVRFRHASRARNPLAGTDPELIFYGPKIVALKVSQKFVAGDQVTHRGAAAKAGLFFSGGSTRSK
jgi:hypothetical protein